MSKLGEHMMSIRIAVHGKITKHGIIRITEEIIKSVGLSPARGAMFCNYPINGKGGFGFTYFKAITESFIAWDVWPKLNGAYLIICSCKLIWVHEIKRVLENSGLKIANMQYDQISLFSETQHEL
jgi:hypothetical protein